MAYQIERRERMSFWERMYLPGIARALTVTARHFFTNLIHLDRRITIEYPDEEHRLPLGARMEHRLMVREDGSIRCTACMLCATICPAKCISIEAEEVPDPTIEKRARTFVIDELRCVFCGLCVEACPCDAIRMDTGRYKNAAFTRSALLYTKEKLLANASEGQSPLSRNL
jgi:NADH-quinone oxidoreductase subunit I